jgi:hypothetical protein
MPVKNNIVGVWRNVQLVNASNDIKVTTSADGTIYGKNATKQINQIKLLLESANFATEMAVNPLQMIQGTAFTKAVDIKSAKDTLTINGPMLLAELPDTAASGSYNTDAPLLLNAYDSDFGDASTVAGAYLWNALNIGSGTITHELVDNISMTLDDNGFTFSISLKGDPSSLYPKFYSNTGTTIPYGDDPTVEGSENVDTALRKATWYDFYLPITIRTVTGTTGTGLQLSDTINIAAAIRKWTGNIQIGTKDEFNLIGRGQAPWWSISSVAMNGTFTVVFPILGEISGAGTYHTVVPTWQAVPYPWGEKGVPLPPGVGFGARTITAAGAISPVPTGDVGDRPDVFTISQVGILPLYVKNSEMVLGDIPTNDTDNNLSIVLKKSAVNITAGVIQADVDYEVIFSKA